MGAKAELLWQKQVFQLQFPDRFAGRVAKHALGTGIESTDHTLQAGRDDSDLGSGIEHTAQLIMRLAQRLLTDAQLSGALLHQLERTLPLAEQVVQQGTEQQA
ncbi:hypothetical protein D3C79_794730 [compost metagenome]